MTIIIITVIIIIGTALIIKLRLSFQWQRCLRKPWSDKFVLSTWPRLVNIS